MPAKGSAIGCSDLAKRFSREDLLRAFDLLTKAEADIRNAAQPRYHLEMALLRWIHLRKLMPIEELIRRLERRRSRQPPRRGQRRRVRPRHRPRRSAAAAVVPPARRPRPDRPAARRAIAGAVTHRTSQRRRRLRRLQSSTAGDASLKDAFSTEIRKSNAGVVQHRLVVQAQRIDVAADRIVLTFAAAQKIGADVRQIPAGARSVGDPARRTQDDRRGRHSAAKRAAPADGDGGRDAAGEADRKSALKEQALADAGVQALLEVFPAEIRDVEEM